MSELTNEDITRGKEGGGGDILQRRPQQVAVKNPSRTEKLAEETKKGSREVLLGWFQIRNCERMK